MAAVSVLLVLTMFGAAASTAACELICATERCHDVTMPTRQEESSHSHSHAAFEAALDEQSVDRPSSAVAHCHAWRALPQTVAMVPADCHESRATAYSAIRVEATAPIQPIAIVTDLSPPPIVHASGVRPPVHPLPSFGPVDSAGQLRI